MATAPLEEEQFLYPSLNPQNFRFSEIVNVKHFLEREVDCSLALYKKYKKLLMFTVGFRYFVLFASIFLNAAGIATLSKIFEHNLAIYFESAALTLDLLIMVISFIEKKISKKIEKHDEVHTLAASFLSTLMNHFSKALDDGNITQQELSLVLAEQAKYLELRKEVRTKDFHQSDSQDLIKRFRQKTTTN